MNKLSVSVLKLSILAMLLCMIFSLPVSASSNDVVYVAGNPDLFPIEYYDNESDTYMGVIPDMLKVIGKETGIDFMYISSKVNEQESMARNKQAEIITSILSDDNNFDNVEKYPVLTVEIDGKSETYCIGFTQIASEELKTNVKSVLSKITDSQKTGMIIANVNNNNTVPKTLFIIGILIAFVVAVIITVSIFLIINYKKRKKINVNNMIDEVTGIGNGEYYVYAFENLISEQSKNLYNLAYIAFDSERMKKIRSNISVNDIEKYASANLNTSVGATEYIAHISEGVFVFLYQAESKDAAERRVSEILQKLNNYISEFDANINNLFKVGLCRLCEHIGANAEGALYNAKQGYLHAESNNLSYHTGSEIQLAENKKTQKLMTQINDAFENDEFRIYMQFITDGNTGSICGAEVLSRWQNSEYGLLHPHEYIEILKDTGKIVEHDYNVFENVCRQLEKWNSPPFDNLFLTCNFTRLSVSESDFAQKLKQISDKYKFSHNRLVIEITEDSLSVNSDIVSQNIKKCSSFGFKIAIDDMGSGFSSLSDIYDNIIDIVKIERNFISTCITERRLRMLGDIIALVHNAGAKVICEGIETSEQIKMLKNINCDMLQGFYNSRVLPLSECDKFVLQRNH